MSSLAAVSVGMPVFNAEATLESALGSLLAQDFDDLDVVISDNASSDRSVEICRDLVGADQRFRIMEQERNGGWQFNFRTTLAHARAPYFMWFGSDDRVAPTFISRNAEALRSDPRAVTAISRVGWLREGQPAGVSSGTSPLTGTPRENVATYLRHARDNTRFYGLHRREVLEASFPSGNFFCLDLAVMLGTLRFGTHLEVPDVLLERERHEPSSYGHQIQADARGRLDLVLPAGRFTHSVVRDLRVPLSPRACLWLAVRNVYEHLRYWSETDGLYARTARPLYGALERQREQSTRRDDRAARLSDSA